MIYSEWKKSRHVEKGGDLILIGKHLEDLATIALPWNVVVIDVGTVGYTVQ